LLTSEHVLALLLKDARPRLELLRAQEAGHGERLGLRRARLHGLAVAILVVSVVVAVVVVMIVIMVVVVAVLVLMLVLGGLALLGLEFL
jgi:hypothetical protein